MVNRCYLSWTAGVGLARETQDLVKRLRLPPKESRQ